MTHLQRLKAALGTIQADGILVSSEINQRYLTDFHFSDGYLLITEDDAILLTDSRYIEAAKASVKEFDSITATAQKGMKQTLAELIAERRITRLAMEDESLSCASYRTFCDAFAGCELIFGGSRLLTELRSIKTAEELDRMARAQAITDAAFSHILAFISPNVTEQEVALELEYFMRRKGAEACAFSTIAVSGSASSLPHGVPRNKLLERGFLTMDFGARVDGYCSDMTRTVAIGKVSEEMKTVYNTVLRAQMAALEFIAEGVFCKEADATARSIIKEAGYGKNFGHSLGHGVGMLVHEAPRLAPTAPADSRLVRGNVVTVEPGIYLEGRFGCRIEDMVAIDLDGSVRNFTKSPKELIEL
ncbi:MAG: aminopeptidase P family protein [Clostridia bacterium]|nr:aminopeptidase P family protein [Clostridia bacterium]